MTDKLIKLRATITWTIEIDPQWYERGTPPEKMAEIEGKGYWWNAMLVGASRPDFLYTVRVEANNDR
jgi:hypothetical protein